MSPVEFKIRPCRPVEFKRQEPPPAKRASISHLYRPRSVCILSARLGADAKTI